MPTQIETERKYLIRMPDEARLAAMDGCEIWEIEQIYLCDGPCGETRRIRRVLTGGAYRYYQTEKTRVSALSSLESEAEISPERYAELKTQANPALNPIFKRRYRIPHRQQTLEIDVYAFWSDRATLEIELADENVVPAIPEWIQIVREVSGEAAYKNRRLAQAIPMEKIS